MVKIKRSILFFLVFLATQSLAQTTRHHGVFWGRLILADKITEKLKWELYLQKRTQNVPGSNNIFGAPHFSSLWFWLNYPVTKNLKLSVSPFGYFNSYAFLTKPSDIDVPGIKEFRWVVRLEQEQKLRHFNYLNRYSLEYRRRDLNNEDVYQPNWRVRYQVRFEKPVTGILPNKKPVSFFVSDELFIQFGKAVRNNPNVFDQNRFSGGFSFEAVKNIKLSLSYLNIFLERNNGKDFDDAHTLWVVLTFDNLFSQFRRSSEN